MKERMTYLIKGRYFGVSYKCFVVCKRGLFRPHGFWELIWSFKSICYETLCN